MRRYIDADLLKDKTTRVNNIWNVTTNAEGKGLDEIIDDIPPADVRENVRGNLVNIEPSITVIDVIDTPSGGALLSMDKACSKCKTPIPPNLCDDVWFKYCPFCGADIRRES